MYKRNNFIYFNKQYFKKKFKYLNVEKIKLKNVKQLRED